MRRDYLISSFTQKGYPGRRHQIVVFLIQSLVRPLAKVFICRYLSKSSQSRGRHSVYGMGFCVWQSSQDSGKFLKIHLHSIRFNNLLIELFRIKLLAHFLEQLIVESFSL